MIEKALTFECAGEILVGVVAVPDRARDAGVLIIVGGPQYRVGSHRQFVQLARRLAGRGYPAMRFDYRGMGDSSGNARSFEDVSDDIAAAIEAFRQAVPNVEKVVLWGLCDAASAALLYLERDRSSLVAGVVLANPWVRSEVTIAKTHVRHYYAARLFEREFWTKVARGQINPRRALGGFLATVRSARRDAQSADNVPGSFRERMASGLAGFGGPVLLVLSGRDLTAREFEEHARVEPTWRRLLAAKGIERCDIEEADHTFSAAASRERVEIATIDWIERRVHGVDQ
jgi:exosortase A-associated hydrolase 1